jgi:hypothetical protein
MSLRSLEGVLERRSRPTTLFPKAAAAMNVAALGKIRQVN